MPIRSYPHVARNIPFVDRLKVLEQHKQIIHQSIKNTLIYTQLIEFKEDDFVCKVAKTIKEASELIESGFEFVCAMDDAQLFKKRK